jgi:hypothetical protein
VKVISATESISEGAEGIILESVLEGMAEYYSAELAEKVKRGQTENALKARYNGGTIPLGYVIDEHQNYQLDTLYAPVIREIFERYADGVSVADIIKGLIAKGVQTKKGGQLSFNSFRNIICNRRYLGEYIYGDTVIPDAIPAIVTQELFDRAQARLEKNKRAPAKAKAKEDYLLTTKLYCGSCGTFMVGESGTGKLLKTYHYYKCLSAKRKRGCERKSVKKDWIEEIVVRYTVNFVLKDDEIKRIAKILVEIQDREDAALPLLRKQLEETEKGLENLANAIIQGLLTPTTKNKLEELEARKSDLEIAILQAELQQTLLTEEQIIFWISRFKGGDINDKAFQRAIIDIFVNAIYLYDDRIVFTYNYKSDARTVSLAEVEVSDLAKCAPPFRTNANPTRVFIVGEAFAFVFEFD